MKKKLTQIITFIGFIVFLSGMTVDVITAEEASEKLVLFNSLASIFSLATALACYFVFSKNKTIENIGYVFSAISGVQGLLVIILNEKLNFYAIGLIIMLVAAIIYALTAIIGFFGYVKGKANTEESDTASLLSKYKELEKEKVLTEEEFEKLKNKALDEHNTEKLTVNELKKWKKLLDGDVITAEEFSKIKEKSFR